MKTNIFYLVFTAYFATKVATQVTTTEPGDEDDSRGPLTTEAVPSICGFANRGTMSVYCLSNMSCATLDLTRRGGPYVGCCDDDECTFLTTCVESGIVFGKLTLQCTGSPLSRCATRTWRDISATNYFCATSPTILTYTKSKDMYYTTKPTEDIPTTAYVPTSTSDSGDDNDDDGDPGMDWEHDLSSKQRVGAGVGSGVIGGLLLMFFG
ncbi:hypothetical protein LCI18_012248 [Fusarium solani-melongenae]|uniref:Uncharacterized protein n=1 Tax=Fusarium solani subsp. cucurbitae TaxID=2747967 RepID=A0ACD3ZMJ2_FUSSC|nr:hypothetical protein LCI18_012248 [Fusarium solani-melongenae]